MTPWDNLLQKGISSMLKSLCSQLCLSIVRSWFNSLVFGYFRFFSLLVSLTFPPHSLPYIRSMYLLPCPPFGFQWSNISQAFSKHMLSENSDMYFEYSKCGTFCESLIYVHDWLLFSLPWQRSVIFSPLQIVLMKKNEPFFCIILQLFCSFVFWHNVIFYYYYFC